MSILHPPGATSGPEMFSAIVANIVANVCSELGKMLEIKPLNKRTGEIRIAKEPTNFREVFFEI